MTTLHHIWQHHYNSDFAAGVKLLSDHNPGAVTRKILSRLQVLAATGAYVSKYEADKLANALHATVIPADTDAPIPEPEKSDRVMPVAPGEGPSVIPITSDRAKDLHKEHAHTHALLVTADTDEKRALLAEQIMEEIAPALDKEYDRLRAGAPAAEETASEPVLLTDAQKIKRVASLRSRISAIRGKLQKEKKSDRVTELKQQLEANIAAKEQLEKELAQ